jgi:putative transposase
MISAVKILLLPTKEQEKMFFRSAGCNRFAYNFMLTYCNEEYRVGTKKTPAQARDVLTGVKDTFYSFLNEVSADSWRNASQDLQKAFSNFFEGRADYPEYKTRKSKISFYHDNRKLQINDKKIRLEKIGWVKYVSDQDIPKGNFKKDKIKVSNPRIGYDNKQWHLTFGIESDCQKEKPLEGLSIGIDLGINKLAVLSTGDTVKNINKTKKVKLLKKRHRRLSRQISRKYESNKQGTKFVKTKNIKKLENKRRLLDRKLTNIRNNHLHQTTRDITKRKPSKVVVETLNVKGMMANRHLAESIAECKFYEFQRQLEYKLKKYLGVKLIKADRFFPSSKLCSCCGYKYNNKDYEKQWSLSIRGWTCVKCNAIHDRDSNASINLANYNAGA